MTLKLIVPMMKDSRLLAEVAAHRFPLLFATVSGAHLYGFPSPDSDYDLRGAHVAPVSVLAGLDPVDETVKVAHVRDGMDVDLVTHEVRKFFRLLLRNNGYVLEQLYSPLVVATTPEHEQLKAIARGCITRACVRHYLGFAENQWLQFSKESPRRVKPLLYVFRVLLSGVHMMRTGEVNANLRECNDSLGSDRLGWINDLISQKIAGEEQSIVGGNDRLLYEREYRRYRALLVREGEASKLPQTPTAEFELRALLARIRDVGSVAA